MLEQTYLQWLRDPTSKLAAWDQAMLEEDAAWVASNAARAKDLEDLFGKMFPLTKDFVSYDGLRYSGGTLFCVTDRWKENLYGHLFGTDQLLCIQATWIDLTVAREAPKPKTPPLTGRKRQRKHAHLSRREPYQSPYGYTPVGLGWLSKKW